MAEELVAQGKVQAVKRVLSLVVPPDPEAVAALDLAKLLENNGQLEQAVDAYLKTYRISPALLDDEHLPTRPYAIRCSIALGASLHRPN